MLNRNERYRFNSTIDRVEENVRLGVGQATEYRIKRIVKVQDEKEEQEEFYCKFCPCVFNRKQELIEHYVEHFEEL